MKRHLLVVVGCSVLPLFVSLLVMSFLAQHYRAKCEELQRTSPLVMVQETLSGVGCSNVTLSVLCTKNGQNIVGFVTTNGIEIRMDLHWRANPADPQFQPEHWAKMHPL